MSLLEDVLDGGSRKSGKWKWGQIGRVDGALKVTEHS